MRRSSPKRHLVRRDALELSLHRLSVWAFGNETEIPVVGDKDKPIMIEVLRCLIALRCLPRLVEERFDLNDTALGNFTLTRFRLAF
jgi:hypothetical protein